MHRPAEPPPPFWRARGHRAHLFGALPDLLLLAGPLMHVFMYRGQHHRHHATRDRSGQEQRH